MLIVQNGDFLGAIRNFERGEAEAYLDQKASVDFVCGLTEQTDVVVTSVAPDAYDERPMPGLRTIGVSQREMYGADLAPRLLDEVAPTLAVPRFPHAPLLRGLHQRGILSFPCFADIFSRVGLRETASRKGLGRVKYNHLIRRALASPFMTAVGNHSLSASRSLSDVLGLDERRIVPWEWTRLQPRSASDGAALVPEPGVFRLVYAGTVSVEKGVRDLVEAVGQLGGGVASIEVLVFGVGPFESEMETLAAALPERVSVKRMGRMPNLEVRRYMAGAQAVVVPSRPVYAEGLPNVIFEALAAGAALIVSDHPSFRDRLIDGQQALVARAGDSRSLASCIDRLMRDGSLRQRLRENTAETLAGLYVGRSWYELMRFFVDDPQDRSGWVAANSLAALAGQQNAGDAGRNPALAPQTAASPAPAELKETEADRGRA